MKDELIAIASEKGQTLAEAAAEIGVSRRQLERIAKRLEGNGTKATFGTLRFWRGMVRWSGGRITPDLYIVEDIEAACAGSGHGPFSCRRLGAAA